MITPVQFYNDLFWKRDDYYRPFGDLHVNGGKVRQTFAIFENKINDIKNIYSNGVITSTSVHSPQAPSVAAVANYYGVKCINVVGGTKESNFKNLPLIRLSQYYGSTIKIVAKHGMPAVVYKRMLDIAQKTNFMPIEINKLIDSDLLFKTTIDQVENLPDDLDILVVPTAAAVRLAGILIGLKIFNKNVKRIVAVCVGPPRKKQLDNFFQMYYTENRLFGLNTNSYFKQVEWISYYDQKIPYSKLFPFKINGEPVDPIYEGKAVDWVLKNTQRTDKILIWCVGISPSKEDVDTIIERNL